ncbi:MAG: hypothetical protein SFW67_33710 [Myxococcaceae bacterium]|nr:hypothetical protein [Myxococcaceae bacterium]
MHITNGFTLMTVARPLEVSAYLQEAFGLRAVFEADWYAQLKGPGFELGVIAEGHESIPPDHREVVRGAMLTLEVADAAQAFEQRRADWELVHGLRDEVWGQRHFMVRTPVGLVVDVVQPLGTPLPA